MLHGAADRILNMAENQASHRQGLERRALTGDLVKAMMGTILAYITFAGAMAGAVYLLVNDKPALQSGSTRHRTRRRLRPKNLRRLHPTQSTSPSTTPTSLSFLNSCSNRVFGSIGDQDCGSKR